MNIATRQMIERGVIKRSVRAALDAGHVISVHDGGETTVFGSRSFAEIVRATMTTDEDSLRIRAADGRRVGAVFLVYGNDGFDVIADHTDTPEMAELLRDAEAYARHAEFHYC
jgi:hypothetical protein